MEIKDDYDYLQARGYSNYRSGVIEARIKIEMVQVASLDSVQGVSRNSQGVIFVIFKSGNKYSIEVDANYPFSAPKIKQINGVNDKEIRFQHDIPTGIKVIAIIESEIFI